MQTANITDKIMSYFSSKYPASFETTGLSRVDVTKLVTKLLSEPGDIKPRVNNLISLIEQQIKQRIYAENRIGVSHNMEKYVADPVANIPYDKFVDKPFDPSPEERPFVYNLVIDSKDRDYTKYPCPANFTVEFRPPHTHESNTRGHIDMILDNIISCEIVDVILLDTSIDESASDHSPLPYILLEMPEFGGNFHGTNDVINKSFLILTTYKLQNGYKHFNINTEYNGQSLNKIYNPRINLNKLSVKLKLPDGTPYILGTEVDQSKNTVLKLNLRVTTLRKNLGANSSIINYNYC